MTGLIYIIFYTIIALNLIWGVLKKKSNVLYAVALAVIFVLMTFNCQGPDIEAYVATYNLVGDATNLKSAIGATYMEKGYAFLMYCANKVGLDFYAFRIILTFVCLILLVSTIKYYKVNPNFIIGLYMLYLFFFDTIQLRNCIMQLVVLFGTRYLFKKSNISIVKYIICIAIASSFHVLAWLYLSLLLVRFSTKKSFYQVIFLIAASLFAVCVLLRPVLPKIINEISKFLNRGEGYFHSNLRFNYLVVMLLHMLSIIPMYLYSKKLKDLNTKNRVDMILYMEIIMGLFLPLTFINSNFNRVFRNVLILDTIGLTLLYEKSPKNTNANDVTLLAQLLLVLGWLFTDLYRNRNVDIIGDILNHNVILNNINLANMGQYVIVVIVCLATAFVFKSIYSYYKKQHRKIMRCD